MSITLEISPDTLDMLYDLVSAVRDNLEPVESGEYQANQISWMFRMDSHRYEMLEAAEDMLLKEVVKNINGEEV